MARKFLRKEKLDKESTSTEKKKHLTVNLIFKSIKDFILSSLTKKNAVSSLLTSRMTFHLLSRMEISRNKRDMADFTRR